MNEPILITGGAGYIGSHACVALMEAGYPVVVIDNFSNSSPQAVKRIGEIVGRSPALAEGDICDHGFLERVFNKYHFAAVLHFAGLKAVGESVDAPVRYYENNVCGTVALLAAMQRARVQTLVFSSSATVYGDPATVPIREDAPRSATNPYGRSKLIIEDVLDDLSHAQPDWRIARLRYFNPIGAHPSGKIGENPRGIPTNLLPFIAQVADGRRQELSVYGGDYPTSDGTGMRDYIHVVDLVDGHLAALRYCEKHPGLITVNLGTGIAYSVLQVVRAFENACGRTIPYNVVARRPGDVARCWADPTRAAELLGWRATRDLEAMCRDAWRWQLQSIQDATEPTAP